MAPTVTAPKHPDPIPKPVPAPEPEWTDPTHKRVLGPARWMAQPDEATRAALDHAIDTSPAPVEVARQAALHTLHTNGRDRARAEAQVCVTRLAPDIKGRVMIGTDLSARSGRGVFVSPRILAAVYLDDPELHACILDALARARFDAGEDIDLPDARFPLFF